MGKQKGDQAKAQARERAGAASGNIETAAGQEGPPSAQSGAQAPHASPETKIAPSTWAHARRLAPLAASLALAAAVGGMAGSLATSGPGAIWSFGAVAQTAAGDAGPSRGWVASINEQLLKLSGRFNRPEGAQVEPAATLARLSDRGERIESGASAADRDTTGSIASAAQQAAAAEPVRPVLAGWFLRRVSNGKAFIQGRPGLLEVVPGTNVAGAGRIESIRRQDGRWVVLTSRGMIVGR